MDDVPDDGHGEAVDLALFLVDGEQVEQGLGRVLVGAVARVDDRNVEEFSSSGAK